MRVVPRASTTKVGGRYGDADPAVLIVRVRAPAVDGAANVALVAALANSLELPPSAVRIVSGRRSRTKLVEVQGVDRPSLVALLAR